MNYDNVKFKLPEIPEIPEMPEELPPVFFEVDEAMLREYREGVEMRLIEIEEITRENQRRIEEYLNQLSMAMEINALRIKEMTEQLKKD